jgi:predicted lipid-binding transport protein (Tim44 family)
MTKFLTFLVALVTLSVFAFDADARRMGGGRTIGKQREAISQQQAAPKAPAQQQQQAASGTTTPAQQQPSGMSKWLGPLTGLALGAGLAALFLHNGVSGLLAGMLMIGLIIAAAVYVARLVRGRTAAAPMQYASAGMAGGNEPARIEPALVGGAAPHSVAAMNRWPAGFDATEFVRHAKLNFVRMQATHDQKDLTAIRDFVTPELYPEIEADIRAAGDDKQQTEVVTLNAEVLDVATEADLYVVSVRFSGLIREVIGEEPQPFNEVWHLEKPVSGRGGWVVAGIQQD